MVSLSVFFMDADFAFTSSALPQHFPSTKLMSRFNRLSHEESRLSTQYIELDLIKCKARIKVVPTAGEGVLL